MTWVGHNTEDLELNADLVFDPRSHREWDGEQASLHAMTIYTEIVRWTRSEFERLGLDPKRYEWIGRSLIFKHKSSGTVL